MVWPVLATATFENGFYDDWQIFVMLQLPRFCLRLQVRSRAAPLVWRVSPLRAYGCLPFHGNDSQTGQDHLKYRIRWQFEWDPPVRTLQ